jgi:uncharacterized membrane protein YqiK
MNRILTLKQLTDADACKPQLALFKDTFGDQAEVTVELAISVADKFDWTWAANNLLSYPALAEYHKAKAPALAEYQKAMATAWAEYNKAKAPALAEYQKAMATAWAEYNKAKAPALAKAYIMDK